MYYNIYYNYNVSIYIVYKFKETGSLLYILNLSQPWFFISISSEDVPCSFWDCFDGAIFGFRVAIIVKNIQTV